MTVRIQNSPFLPRKNQINIQLETYIISIIKVFIFSDTHLQTTPHIVYTNKKVKTRYGQTNKCFINFVKIVKIKKWNEKIFIIYEQV